MTERYAYIAAEKARELLAQAKEARPAKRGVDRQAYLVGDYAVLAASRIKLRNVATRDDDLAHFDALIATLMRLHGQGVAVVPILGYCYDPESEKGAGYIIQPRAKGEELYDDAVMQPFYVRKSPYLSSDGADPKAYLLSRTSFISQAPQRHFDKFVSDVITLLDHDILIDFMGKSNFFYDKAAGFQFIDLDSHTDYKYGLAARRCDSREVAAYNAFVPCHQQLDKRALKQLSKPELRQLRRDNQVIFEKCKAAMLCNGVAEGMLREACRALKPF